MVENGTLEEELKPPSKCYGVRHTQAALLFIMIVIAYGMRASLSVTIVAMTDPTTTSNPNIPTYKWNNSSTILSSFFWGYIILQIGAGVLAKKLGPKWPLIGAITVCSLSSLLIPTMAEKIGSGGVMACRVLQGLSQGFVFPSTHAALSRWAPLPERSRIGSFVYSGGSFGTFMAMPVTGWISASKLGWPWGFYFYGALGLTWVLVYFILGADSPASHRSITVEERYYIEKSLGHLKGQSSHPVPWKCIFTSMPMWALIIAHCGYNWGFWTLLTEIPSFMNYIMKFDMRSNGLLSSAPYFIYFLLGFVFSPITDKLITKHIVSIGAARKIMNSIGTLISAIALAILTFTTQEQKTLVTVLLMVTVGFNAAVLCGFNINHIDLSPNHSGTLMGITNCLSNITGILAPLAVQYIVTDHHDVNQWRIVFWIAASIYIIADVIYILCGSGETQYWDSIEEKRDEHEEDKF